MRPLADQRFNTSTRVFPRRAGDGETAMPAASMAAILLSASPLPPEMIAPGVAHAAAGGRGAAGDEADGRLLAAALRLVGQELRRILLGRAADLADHDDRFRLRVGEEEFQHGDELGALDGVAADADRGGLAEAFARWSGTPPRRSACRSATRRRPSPA